MKDLEETVRDFLENGDDWEKMDVEDVEGVTINKMPATKKRPAKLAIEINPVKNGRPIKRKGLFITSSEMLIEFSEILTKEEIFSLIKIMDLVNSENSPEKTRETLKIKE